MADFLRKGSDLTRQNKRKVFSQISSTRRLGDDGMSTAASVSGRTRSRFAWALAHAESEQLARIPPIKHKEQIIRESCSLVECTNAAGDFLTATIIWKAKSGHRRGRYRDSEEERAGRNWWYGYSEKGYNNKKITLEWLDRVFNPETELPAENRDE
jgi:hypothetical protein